MYAEQYPQVQQDSPPYQNNMQANRQSLNYYRPAEEHMVDFQELVARYESEFN